jgi:dTDP-4-dehydrorhamnose reductase
MMDEKKTVIALIGSSGMLAQMISRIAPKTYEVIPYDLPEFDITDRDLVLGEMNRLNPDYILNCAAFTHVDDCETEEALATQVNGEGPGFLAEAAKEIGSTFVHISTDYVFDGFQRESYREEDAPHPQSAYGRSKLKGERAIQNSGLEKHFILRTSWLYGPGGKNFVETILRLGKEREELRIVADQVGNPTYTEDLAAAIFRLIEMEKKEKACPYGIYHFSNEGACTWYDFACVIIKMAREAGENLQVGMVSPIKTEEYPLPAPRPPYSVLGKEKYKKATGGLVPSWQEALSRYFSLRLS